MITNDISKFITKYVIVPEIGEIEFFNEDGLAFKLKYFEGEYNFDELEGIPKVYEEIMPKCATNGSYLIKSSDNGFDVFYKQNDGLLLIFDSSVYNNAIESIHKEVTVANGSEPITVLDSVKVASFNGNGIDISQDFDDIFFNENMIFNKEDIGIKVVNIIVNHRDLYVVDEDGVVYLYTIDIDVMGINHGVKLIPLGKSASFLDKDGAIVAGHFVRLDGSNIIITKLNDGIDNSYQLSGIDEYSSILSAQGNYSTVIFITDSNQKITIERLNVSEAIIEPYQVEDINTNKYLDLLIYEATTTNQDNIVELKSKINTSELNVSIPEGAIDFEIYNDYTMVFLYSDGAISFSSVVQNNIKDIRIVDNNEIFIESGTVCEDGYMEVQDIRASTIASECIVPDYIQTWGTAYGLLSCDNFAICSSNDIAVQIENGYDKYMSIIDISNRAMSLKNPYKLVKLKYNAAVAVAIYNNKIFVAFSDRILVEYNMIGVYQKEYDLSKVINHEIQDMTADCSGNNGLYILTSITNTVYRFDGINFSTFCHSFVLENQTDRTAIGTIGIDKLLASSTSVSSNKILGINSDGTLNDLYQFDNDEIVNIDIDDNKLYVVTAYYPFAIREYLI